ncbi:MAG: hypothetical protein ACO1OT_06375 [Heyndrickxia sp.]
MKKLIFIIVLLIAVGGGLIYFIQRNKNVDPSHLIEKDNMKEKKFLENKQAVIFVSSTIDQDANNKGQSYAVFVDDNGVASGFKMKSLELGSVAKGNQGVLLVDKEKIRLVGSNYQEFNMKKEQHTGERTGYLEKQNVYFSIFNTGVKKSSSENGYDSNILFGNKNGFKVGNIPHFILTSGVDQKDVVILTNDKEKKYDLRKVTITNDELKIQNIVQLENKKGYDYANLSQIVGDQDFYYVVLNEYISENSENTVLFRVNKKTLAQEKFILATYKTVTAAVPYNPRNSAYVFQNEFYYMNGLGEVFAFNTKTNEFTIKYTIKDAPKDGVRHNEGTYFQDGNLYVMRYNNHNKYKYYIEEYSLETGERLKAINIKGLNELLTSVKKVSIHAYDFRMLK